MCWMPVHRHEWVYTSINPANRDTTQLWCTELNDKDKRRLSVQQKWSKYASFIQSSMFALGEAASWNIDSQETSLENVKL